MTKGFRAPKLILIGVNMTTLFYETLEATGTSLSNASVVEFGLLEVSGSGSTKVIYNSTVNKKHLSNEKRKRIQAEVYNN